MHQRREFLGGLYPGKQGDLSTMRQTMRAALILRCGGSLSGFFFYPSISKQPFYPPEINI